MDGNGRWAQSRNLPRLKGHEVGVETLQEIVRVCPSLGVDTLTLFAFAIANWKRDRPEVDGLWSLFHLFFTQHIHELIAEGVRIKILGSRKNLSKEILADIEKAEADSKDNSKFLLQVALNYDGIDEVARMVQQAIDTNVASQEITSSYVLSHLDTMPGNDPDIIIRTGMPEAQRGMSVWRSSSFLPLQSVESVCVSTVVLWPDITKEHIEEIITFAHVEQRLFGGQRNT